MDTNLQLRYTDGITTKENDEWPGWYEHGWFEIVLKNSDFYEFYSPGSFNVSCYPDRVNGSSS